MKQVQNSVNTQRFFRNIPEFRCGNKIKSLLALAMYGTLAIVFFSSGENQDRFDTAPVKNVNSQTNIVNSATNTTTPTSVLTDIPKVTIENLSSKSPNPTNDIQPTSTIAPKPTNTPVPKQPTSTPRQPDPTPTSQPKPQTNFSCAVEKTCTEMTSCDEAYYHLNVCGFQKRDGDNDGIPCEAICPGG